MKRNKILLLALSAMMLIGCTNNGSSNSSSSSNNPSTSESTSTPSTSESTTNPETSEESSSESTLVPETSDQPTSEDTTIPETSEPSIPVDPVEKEVTITINGSGTEGQAISKDAFITDSSFKLTEQVASYCGSAKELEAVRLGSGSKFGVLTFTTSDTYKIKSMVISAKTYGSDSNCKLEVSLSNGEKKTNDITSSSYQDYNFTFVGSDDISSFEISSVAKKKRVYINKITFSATLIEGNNPVEPELPDSSIPDSSEDSSNGETSHKPITPGADISNPENDPYQGNYYTKISETSTGDQLIKQLKGLITSTHHPKGYDALYDAYEDGDNRPGTHYVWDMYSDTNYRHHKDKAGQYKVEGDCYNREHSVPQSWFEGTSGPMKSDYFHVVPADGKVNGIRSNYPFGELANPKNAKYTSRNGCMLGTDSRGQTVFEPCDEFKGDFARMYFYMITRYNDLVGKWGHVFTSSYPYLTSNYFDLYVKWALEDPVSEKEIIRNDAGQRHQGNRNPYVDHPSYFYRAFVK